MNTFNEANYIKRDEKNKTWRADLPKAEAEKLMLNQRGFSFDDKDKLLFNHAAFIKYAMKRFYAVNNNEKVYFYNLKTKSYERLSPEQYKKIFFYIIEEASEMIWKRKYENEYISYFLRKLKYSDDNGMKPGLLHFPNCIIDIEEGKMYDPTHEIFSLVQIPYEYDANADAPKFKAFLNDIFEGDQERIDLVQEIMGTCLYYDDIMQKLIIFLGTGSNGKSLLANIIKKMLGEKNVSAIALDNLSAGRFAKQNLDRKLLNISSETKTEKLYSTADLKSLTGGDSVEIEEKFEKSYTTEIHTKFILLANDMIQTKDYSDGFYRRLMIIPFNQCYHDLSPNEKPEEGVCYKNAELEYELEEELPGIFNFAYEGLMRIVENNYNFTYSSACEEALEHYKNEHNVVKAFYNECIETDNISPKSCTKKSNVYGAFLTYCRENRFNNNISSIQFYRILDTILIDEKTGVRLVHRNDGDYFKGLILK